jgi:hypothetical protein
MYVYALYNILVAATKRPKKSRTEKWLRGTITLRNAVCAAYTAVTRPASKHASRTHSGINDAAVYKSCRCHVSNVGPR